MAVRRQAVSTRSDKSLDYDAKYIVTTGTHAYERDYFMFSSLVSFLLGLL